VLVVLAVGPVHLIGVYAGGASHAWVVSTLLAWFGRDALLLTYTAGWILVTAGVVGLVSARTRAERAFAVFTTLFVAGLLLEAGWIAAIDSKRFEERYLMLVTPLLAVSFALWAKRGAPRKPAVALVAIALLVFSMRVPLSGYVAFHGRDGSPFLTAVARLEQLVGIGEASLVVALAAGALSACIFALVYRPRIALPLGFSVVLVSMAGVSLLAASYDKASAQRVRSVSMPADLQWVDHAGQRQVSLLVLPGSDGQRALENLFWNRSITDVLRLDAKPIDGYAQPRVDVADDGALRVAGRTFAGPLLVQEDGSRATFTGVTQLATGNYFQLLKPRKNVVPRLALLASGLYADGWLASWSFVRVWPDASGRVEGTLHLRLSLPRDSGANSISLKAPGIKQTLRLAPGVTRDITVAVSQRGPWTITLSSPTPRYLGLRPVSVKVAPPVFMRTAGGRATHAPPVAARRA
jgi:hypothetical protein